MFVNRVNRVTVRQRPDDAQLLLDPPQRGIGREGAIARLLLFEGASDDLFAVDLAVADRLDDFQDFAETEEFAQLREARILERPELLARVG